jgi:hypothetical protein
MKVGTTARYFVDTVGDSGNLLAPGTRIFSPLAGAGLCDTIGRYVYLSIQAFNGGFRRLILPIRAHSLAKISLNCGTTD